MRRQLLPRRLQQVELPLQPTTIIKVNRGDFAKLPPRNKSELRAALADLLRAAVGLEPRSAVAKGEEEDDLGQDHR